MQQIMKCYITSIQHLFCDRKEWDVTKVTENLWNMTERWISWQRLLRIQVEYYKLLLEYRSLACSKSR